MPEIEPANGDRSPGPTDASRVELPEVRGFFGRARQTEEAWRLLMESIKRRITQCPMRTLIREYQHLCANVLLSTHHGR